MKAAKLSSLKKGDYFTLKPIEEPNEMQVYVRDDYYRPTKENFYDNMLDSIVVILESYVYYLNELLFVLKYQPDKFKAFDQANDLLIKLNKADLRLSSGLIKLIFQYLTR